MSLKSAITRILWRIETLLERLRPAADATRAVIEPYIGYSTPEHLVARGRVLATRRRITPTEGQTRLRNARQLISLFRTREVPNATIHVTGTDLTAVSDEEGYVTLYLPRSAERPVAATVEGSPSPAAKLPVLVTDPAATLGVISDIDDTIMHTGAYSLARNLWTTFTGNSLSRQVFPDAVELLARLHADSNPVFFVSSSPWNLHDFLQQVFTRAGVVPGPMFLRDLGLGETKLISSSHGSHKGTSIDTILAANPALPFVLIGDTGQHDAEVYLAAAKRHPGRIRRIILRAPGPGADEHDKHFATEAAALGIHVSIGRDYRTLIRIHPGEQAQPDRAAT